MRFKIFSNKEVKLRKIKKMKDYKNLKYKIKICNKGDKVCQKLHIIQIY